MNYQHFHDIIKPTLQLLHLEFCHVFRSTSQQLLAHAMLDQ